MLLILTRVLREIGYQIELLSCENGDLYYNFTNLDIPVRIDTHIMEESLISWILENNYEVLVNTLQMFGLIYMLDSKDIEVVDS